MALLLRRIKLAVDHHGGTSAKLQFIFLSATVGNPVQLAQRLSGRTRDPNRLVLIDKSGAAASEKRLLVLKPSTNANPDAAKIILYLLKQGMSGITFCNSRQAVKSLLGLVKTEAIRQGCRGYEDKVAIFYGSLTGDRRAEIIEQLQSGQIRFIISTEAIDSWDRPPGTGLLYHTRLAWVYHVVPAEDREIWQSATRFSHFLTSGSKPTGSVLQ